MHDRWFWRWAPGDRKTAWLCAIMAGITFGYLLGVYHTNSKHAAVYALGDFFALWSAGKMLVTHNAALLYDTAWLHAAQVKLGMPSADLNPFPYPPLFMLMIWPFGLLTLTAGYVVWVASTLAFYLAALAGFAERKGAIVAAGLLVPTTAVCAAMGQSGLLLGALLLGGARFATGRPVLAGFLFALIAYKPQFGLMIPVALVAAGQWRCIAATVATLVAWSVVVTILFGVSIWPSWVHSLPTYEAHFMAAQAKNGILRLAPTVVSNLRAIGAPGTLAWVGQIVAIGASVFVTWGAWRRRSPLAVPVLLGATFLAAPHALVYDLPGLSAAVLLFAAWRLRTEGVLELPELAVLLVTLLDPVIMNSALLLPIGALVTALFVFHLYRVDQAIAPPVAQMAKA